MRVLKISCSLLFVAALAQNAGAQASVQSAQGGVAAEKAALASGKKAKGTKSIVAAQPTRVLLNMPAVAGTAPSAVRVEASDQQSAAGLRGAQVRAAATSSRAVDVPYGGPAKAALKRSSAEQKKGSAK